MNYFSLGKLGKAWKEILELVLPQEFGLKMSPSRVSSLTTAARLMFMERLIICVRGPELSALHGLFNNTVDP